jgi:hypothetical protein
MSPTGFGPLRQPIRGSDRQGGGLSPDPAYASCQPRRLPNGEQWRWQLVSEPPDQRQLTANPDRSERLLLSGLVLEASSSVTSVIVAPTQKPSLVTSWIVGAHSPRALPRRRSGASAAWHRCSRQPHPLCPSRRPQLRTRSWDPVRSSVLVLVAVALRAIRLPADSQRTTAHLIDDEPESRRHHRTGTPSACFPVTDHRMRLGWSHSLSSPLQLQLLCQRFH